MSGYGTTALGAERTFGCRNKSAKGTVVQTAPARQRTSDMSDGVDEVRLAPRSERLLPPWSLQTFAHDAAFPRAIHYILLTFLFLRQPASVASPLLREATSYLF